MSILQKFLNHQLITIGEDENLTKLKKACDDVVKKIAKNKSKVVSYTLIALDPEISPENEDVTEVTDTIVKRWMTFVSNTKDTPLTVVRAVMLQSLQTLSETDTIFACLIWLTGRNAIKHYKLGREKDLLGEFLLDIGNRVEREAEESWSLNTENTNPKFDSLKIEVGEITSVVTDKNTLVKMLEDASGPTNKEGTANYKSPNSTWTTTAPQWSYDFAPRAATAIALAINTAITEQSKQVAANQSQIQDAVNELINNFESVISDAQNEILQKNNLLHMRTQLLWWKEAAYSKTFGESYKKLNNDLLGIIIAVDYAHLVPYLYPASADYFLRETYKDFVLSKEENIKISDLLPKIKENEQSLQKVLDDYVEEAGRISFLSFLKGLTNGKYNTDQFKSETGIDLATEIAFSDFVLWMFHDSQAQKIVSSK